MVQCKASSRPSAMSLSAETRPDVPPHRSHWRSRCGVARMSAAAQIQSNGDGNWSILENGEVRATYPYHAIRFSVLWKGGGWGQTTEHRQSNS